MLEPATSKRPVLLAKRSHHHVTTPVEEDDDDEAVPPGGRGPEDSEALRAVGPGPGVLLPGACRIVSTRGSRQGARRQAIAEECGITPHARAAAKAATTASSSDGPVCSLPARRRGRFSGR